MPVIPANCDDGGSGGVDTEGVILCDLDDNGELLGTAFVTYNYEEGEKTGGPILMDPVTGNEYTPQGTMQVCPSEGGSLAPMQFCFNSSTTVATPGRQYDLDLDIAPGYAVDAVLIDLVEYPMGVEWEVTDPTGEEFATRLQQALQSQFRNGQTVTVTPPPPGVICGGKARFQIHIECRVVADAATLVQLRYDAGEDSIQNPAYNEDNGTLEERCQAVDAFTRGGGTYRLLKRQDDGGTINCTNTANRGWETNDSLGEFEVWCNPGVQSDLQVVPTPRGTPVQEINANAPVGGGGDTIWQTFQVTTAGLFTIEAVVGGRQRTEEIRVRLSTGDTDATGIGDRINELIVAPEVTNNANPWTVFERQVQLAPGTYTLSLTGPPTDATGGLFTDLRAYTTDPTRVDFVNDDETCEVDVTTRSTKCEWWTPQPVGGQIAGWERASDGLDLTNAEFWAQVPAPSCCGTDGTDGDAPEAALGNLSESYVVCGTVGGVQQNLQRVVITDQNGGAISQQFLGEDGSPVTPTTWQPGECNNRSPFEDAVICYTLEGDETRRQGFRREAPNAVGQRVVTFLGDDGVAITPEAWTPGPCSSGSDVEETLVCLTSRANPLLSFNGIRRTSFVDGEAVASILLARNGLVVPEADFDWTPGPCYRDAERRPICFEGGIPGEQVTVYDETDRASQIVRRDDGVAVDPGLAWTAGYCGQSDDTEIVVLCDGGELDDNADNVDTAPVQFLRRIVYGPDGAVESTSDARLDGTPYTPVGPVHACELYDVEIDSSIVCADGISYVRREAVLFYGLEPVQTSLAYFEESTGLAPAVFPPAWTFGPCPAAPAIFDTTVSDNTGDFTIAGADLVGWTLRARGRVTGTYAVNGGAPVPFDINETVSSGGVDEDLGRLADSVAVTITAGSVRSTVLRRS